MSTVLEMELKMLQCLKISFFSHKRIRFSLESEVWKASEPEVLVQVHLSLCLAVNKKVFMADLNS